MYLEADNNVVCDPLGKWGAYCWFGGIPAFVVFIFGIPGLFFFLLDSARKFGVEEIVARIKMVGRHTPPPSPPHPHPLSFFPPPKPPDTHGTHGGTHGGTDAVR
jgi:hypothetical protein